MNFKLGPFHDIVILDHFCKKSIPKLLEEYRMPHTTSKGVRTKRIDVRPKASKRKVEAKKENLQLTIQDIRVTKTLKSEIKERSMESGQDLIIRKSTDEIILRALRKKMKAIDELLVKQQNGAILDSQQLQKINTLDNILVEMEKYTK